MTTSAESRAKACREVIDELADRGMLDGVARDLRNKAASAIVDAVCAVFPIRPLVWRQPDTDSLRDPDPEDCILVADGIGGVYSISRKQTVGPAYLLWAVDDPMLWTGFDTIKAAQDAAQADHEPRVRDLVDA